MNDSVIAIIKEVLAATGISHTGIEEGTIAGQQVFDILSDDAAFRADAHGELARSLDHLIKRISEARGTERANFIIDVNGQQTERIRELEMKARMMAERARSFQYDVELAPMSAYERLLVHSMLAKEPSVKTESQGEGKERRIVIRYVTDSEPQR